MIYNKIKRRYLKYVAIVKGESSIYKRLYIDYDKIMKNGISKENLSKSLFKTREILNEMGIDYSLGRGTLLGLYRDNDFVKNDNDIDIDIFEDKNIYDLASKMPFEIVMTTIINGSYEQLVMLDLETGVLIDFWFYKKKKQMHVYTNEYGSFSIPTEQINSLDKIMFGGNEYNCLKPEWYCKYWYGEKWKEQLVYTSTWIDHYELVCDAFTKKLNFNMNIINRFEG